MSIEQYNSKRAELFEHLLKINYLFNDRGGGGLAQQVTSLFCNLYFVYKAGLSNLEWSSLEEAKVFFDSLDNKYKNILFPLVRFKSDDLFPIFVKRVKEVADLSSDLPVLGEAYECFSQLNRDKKTKGAFYTPFWVAEKLLTYINIKPKAKIYDPFCGTGNMLLAAHNYAKDKNIQLFGSELDYTAKIAKMNLFLNGHKPTNIKQQDTLQNPCRAQYDIVFTNIPFMANHTTTHGPLYGHKIPYFELVCILHCLQALKDSEDSTAIIIIPPGILSNCQMYHSWMRQHILTEYNLTHIITLPAATFWKYTAIESYALIINKAKQKTPHIIFEDL